MRHTFAVKSVCQRRVWSGVQGVAANFREIFAALAPGGRGELVMHRRPHSERPPEGAAPDGDEGSSVLEKYSGVGVKVCSCRPVLCGCRDVGRA